MNPGRGVGDIPTYGEVKSQHGCQLLNSHRYSYRIHGAGIYANIGGIVMVNVCIYTIHGSYGYWILASTVGWQHPNREKPFEFTAKRTRSFRFSGDDF